MSDKAGHSEVSEFALKKLEQFGFQQMGSFTSEDVFITGYPKSGNTLLQHVIAHLVFGLRKDSPKSLINSCVTEFYNNPYFFRHNPRHFFKSHELPKPIMKNVIYILRDGREAVRSYYYMQKNMGQKVSGEDLYRTGGKTFVGTWANHVNAWIDNPYNANILIIKYEQLISEKERVILDLCDFLDIERNPQEIAEVIDATSLANMKLMESDYSWKRSKSYKSWKTGGSFVREGKAKGSQDDPNIKNKWISEFEKHSKDMLMKFDYI